jgi:hypothetical protein
MANDTLEPIQIILDWLQDHDLVHRAYAAVRQESDQCDGLKNFIDGAIRQRARKGGTLMVRAALTGLGDKHLQCLLERLRPVPREMQRPQ